MELLHKEELWLNEWKEFGIKNDKNFLFELLLYLQIFKLDHKLNAGMLLCFVELVLQERKKKKI